VDTPGGGHERITATRPFVFSVLTVVASFALKSWNCLKCHSRGCCLVLGVGNPERKARR
jgi:hypothetical protein